MRKAKFVLVPMLVVALAGCGVAQWVKVAEQILPVVLPMVTNMVTAVTLLEGRTVSVSDLNTITKTANQVSADLNLAGQLVSQYQASPNATTIGKINAALADVNANLSALLPALHITDQATTQKVTAIVMLISSEVNSIERILPMVTGSPTKAKAGGVGSGLLSGSQLKNEFNAIVSAPTTNSAVNTAFVGAVLK